MIMLRVSKREERSRTIVIVDGRLSKDYVEVVETFCNEVISTGTIVQLFLRHVSTVDDAGRALLSRLAAKGVRLRASGVYVSHLVRELSLTTVRPQSCPSRARCDTGTCEREAEDYPADD
jgi:ABC-type transporter Mla MlaB component